MNVAYKGIFGFCALLLYQSCFANNHLVFRPCDNISQVNFLQNAVCGKFNTRENPDAVQSQEIDIHILKIPALVDNPLPPIFIIAGGPGQSAIDTAPHLYKVFSKSKNRHDLIFIDQRGTGQSNPLNCEYDESEFWQLSLTEQQRKQTTLFQKCFNQFSADLNYYRTPYAVKDLEDIRSALGYSEIYLWGASYGTRVILDYLRQYPNSIKAAVLDGTSPTNMGIPRTVEIDTANVLEKLFQICQQQLTCAQAFPNIRARWIQLLNQLNDKAQSYSFTHPRTLETQVANVTAEMLSGMVRIALYNRETTSLILFAMDSATKGDYTTLNTIAMLSLDSIQDNLANGLHMAVLCGEDYLYTDQNNADNPQIKPEVIHLQSSISIAHICQLLTPTHLADEYFQIAESNVPTLFLSGDLDPATPAYYASEVVEKFPNGLHLKVEGAHHGVSSLGCVPRIIADFFRSNDIKNLDYQCIDNIKPLAFFIDNAGPTMKDIENTNND